MKYVIKKNSHRARPIVLGLWFDKKIVERNVYFHENSRYNLNSVDQEDTNKLFGIGYLWSHHYDSARFGWSYNPHTDRIKLSAYCYVKGTRVIQDIVNVPISTWINLKLKIRNRSYVFDVTIDKNFFTISVPMSHNKKISYPLGLYFGGNKKAPKDINVSINHV